MRSLHADHFARIATVLRPPAGPPRLLLLLLLDERGDLTVFLRQRRPLAPASAWFCAMAACSAATSDWACVCWVQLRLLGVQRVLGRVQVGHRQVDVALGDLVVLGRRADGLLVG
jgi:hypothetical protein